jgi:hypothetical protein
MQSSPFPPQNPNHPHFDHVAPAVAEGEEVEARSEPEQEEPDDDAPFAKTYIALDGITVDDFTEGDKETLKKELANLLLTNGYPLEGVRILSEEANVIEVGKRD